MVDFQRFRNVLLIKPRAIGDIVLATPVIENLKKNFPELAVDFLCERFAADAVTGNPWIDEVLTFDRRRDSTISIVAKVRARKYDAVIDLFANPRTAMITRCSGAGCRIGFPFRGRRYAYTHHVPPRGGEVHNVDFNLDVLRYFRIPIVSTRPYFPLADEERSFAAAWMEKEGLAGKTVVGLNAGGGWSTKKWGLEHFAQLADRVRDTLGAEILLFWGPGEQNDAQAIAASMRHPCHLSPPSSLKHMGALLTHCSYLVTNDSGPMHIAAALGVPTLGIFGPTDPNLQGPYGTNTAWVRHERLDCLACNLTSCPIGIVCMTDLSVDTVFNALIKLQKETER